jgi:putrescine transport system permease protein
MGIFRRLIDYSSQYFYGKLRLDWLNAFVPLLWSMVFFVIPFLIILKISLTSSQISIPPYGSIVRHTKDYVFELIFNFNHYVLLVKNNFYFNAFFQSLYISFCSTFLCLIVGYIFAYSITQVQVNARPYLLLLVALPFWISFLVRIYAWMSLLSRGGLINQFLMGIGVTQEPLNFLDNQWAVCVSIVYCYLPFMVFPVYNSIVKIPKEYLEAAYNLGCKPWKAFWSITLPLSSKGIKTGCLLVFLPSLGEFVIPELVGGPQVMTTGRVIWFEFFNNRNWPLASAIAVVLVIIFISTLYIFKQKKEHLSFNH